MRISRDLALALGGVIASAGPVGAQDVAAGRAQAQVCAVCHGATGISAQPDAPHLAGQPPVYLVAQLKAYRSGARRHEVMSVIAKPLSDAEIANLAAWYGSIRIEAQLPR